MAQAALYHPGLRSDYVYVPAGQTDMPLGLTGGARGDLLERIIITVNNAQTAAVNVRDGNSITFPILPNSPGNGIGTYVVPLRVQAKHLTSPGWKVTTGAGASVIAVGEFT